MDERQSAEYYRFLRTLQRGIWILGVLAWSFGICDRTTAALSDGYLSAIDMVQLFTASFFFVCWLILKPARVAASGSEAENSVS